ncbi:hypothetical protein [Microtetraspora malaysiensis]|uniref:hypothetical protein n=1 Tax=Microtetraspora malaysiensis TaxID=161358 RepID=UPI003D9263B5
MTNKSRFPSMAISLIRRTALALLVGTTSLAVTACGGPEWQGISTAMLSKDGRTLTVELTFSRPEVDKIQCEKVADTKIEESSSRVIVGVQVQNDCPDSWQNTIAVGYVRCVDLKLKQPLGTRTVLDSVHHQRVRIYQSPDGS